METLTFSPLAFNCFTNAFVLAIATSSDEVIKNIAEVDVYRNLKRGSAKWSHTFHWHKDSTGFWLNLDWSADYPGGPFSEANRLLVIYPNGRFVEGPEKKLKKI